MYALTTHRIWSSVVFSPVLIDGMATFTIVVSSMIMKKPVVRTRSTSHGLVRAWAMPNPQLLVVRIDSARKRLLEPVHVPVAPELPALLGEVGDALEAEF